MKRSLAWFAGTILVTWLLVLVPELTVGQTTPNLAESEQLLEVEELNQQARELYNQGQFAAALEAFEDALIIVRELPVSAMKRQQEGDILYKMGESYNQLSQYRQAAITLSNIGLLYSQQQQYSQALDFLQASRKIEQELGNRQSEGISIYSIAGIYLNQGKYKQALELLEESLAISREQDDPVWVARIIERMGLTLLKSGKLTAATEKLLAAIEVWESLRPGLSDQERVSLFDKRAQTYGYLQQALLAQNEIEAALEIAERGRARALAELLAPRLSNVPEGQVGIKPTTIEEIKQIASQQQATLVEYSVIEDTLLIWVVKPSGEVFVEKVNLPPLKTSLENLVTSARKAIGVRGRGSIAAVSRGNSGSTSDLEQLYQVLISPIAQFLPTNPEERVIFIPHQQLFLVPFPALVDSSGKYLIEKHTILTAPAIQVLQLISRPVKHLLGENKAGGRRQEAVSMKKIFTTMHENPSLRVSASPRPRVSFQSEPTPNPSQEGNRMQEVLVVGNPTMPSIGIPPQQLSPLPGAYVRL